jgi:hypothetical protein
MNFRPGWSGGEVEGGESGDDPFEGGVVAEAVVEGCGWDARGGFVALCSRISKFDRNRSTFNSKRGVNEGDALS